MSCKLRTGTFGSAVAPIVSSSFYAGYAAVGNPGRDRGPPARAVPSRYEQEVAGQDRDHPPAGLPSRRGRHSPISTGRAPGAGDAAGDDRALERRSGRTRQARRRGSRASCHDPGRGHRSSPGPARSVSCRPGRAVGPRRRGRSGAAESQVAVDRVVPAGTPPPAGRRPTQARRLKSTWEPYRTPRLRTYRPVLRPAGADLPPVTSPAEQIEEPRSRRQRRRDRGERVPRHLRRLQARTAPNSTASTTNPAGGRTGTVAGAAIRTVTVSPTPHAGSGCTSHQR